MMEFNETILITLLNCTVATDAFVKKMFYAVVVPSTLSIAGAILVIMYSLLRIWNVPKIVHFICQFRRQQERQQLLPEESPSPRPSHQSPSATTPPSNPRQSRQQANTNFASGSQSTDFSESNEFTATATDTNVPATSSASSGVCTAINHPSAHLLLYISFADVIVAMSHIWGVSMTRDDLAEQSEAHNASWLTECGAQAVFAVFGTIASFLWTLVLAFMAVVMASERVYIKSLTKSTFCFSLYHILLWGIPTAVAVGFGAQGRLGFDQKLDVGWCYVRGGTLALLFGYDLWALIYIVLLALFITMCVYLYYRNKRKNKFKAIKLLTAAVLLIGVRLPIAAHDFMMYSSKGCPSEGFLLASGALTSTQGIINAVVFVIPQVFEFSYRKWRRRSHH